MSQSGSGTPTLGRSVPCMARLDDKEQLPSSNDIASSSNGDTSGEDRHRQNDQFPHRVECRVIRRN